MLPEPPATDHEQPSYFIITFHAAGFPPGAVDVDDLTQFLSGIQDVSEALLRYDYGSDKITSDDLHTTEFVVFRTAARSLKCYIILRPLFNLIAPLLLHVLTDENVRDVVLKGLAEAAISEVGKRLTGLALSRTKRLTSFLQNVTSSNPTPENSELLDRTAPGLKKMAEVGVGDRYQPTSGGLLQIETDVPSEGTIVFDRGMNAQVLDFLEGEGINGESYEIFGKVTQIDTKEKIVRLTVPSIRQRIECRYSDYLAGKVLGHARPNQYIIAVGVPHYRKGSDGSWPPRYVRLTEIRSVDSDPGWPWRRIGGNVSSQVELTNNKPPTTPIQDSLWRRE